MNSQRASDTHGGTTTAATVEDKSVEEGPRPAKRVRISEQLQVVPGRADARSEQERCKSWYTSQEYAVSKNSLKELCRSHRQSRRFSDCLTQAYQTACGFTDQHERIQAQENPVATGNELPDEGLAQWMQGSRGLEGYSSRLHAMRRQRHFQDYKHCVFLEQARQNLNATKDASMLARQAQQSSRRARSFAFLLGQADAWAAHSDESDEDESSSSKGTCKDGWKKSKESHLNDRNISSGDDETSRGISESGTSNVVGP